MTLTIDAPAAFDRAAADAFADRIGNAINDSAITLMMSVGHRTGLFDTMAGMAPASSHRIADAAGLNERYVREWLAVMVVGDVVHFDPEMGTYELPAEHAASLTRDGKLGNLAVYAQFMPMFGAIQDGIIERFRTGEGTAYGDYPCFHTIMAEDSAQTVVSQIDQIVSRLMPEMPARLADGIDVLDAGCGSGLSLIALAARYPASRFVGLDFCSDAIARASRDARSAGLSNIRFEVRDLTGFSEIESFDLITSFDAVHDQKDPQELIEGIHGALRLGGAYLMQDVGGSARLENNIDFPFAAMLYAASCMHCMPVSLGQGGAGLGTMWGWETAERMLHAAGFASVRRSVLDHDPMNVWFVGRKS